MYFEDSVKDSVGQIQRILQFLPPSCFGHKPNLTQRLRCLEADATSGFKRSKRNLTFDPFTRELKQRVNENIHGLRRELENVKIFSLPPYERPMA